MSRLLVIDDEPNLRYSLVKSLQSDTLEVQTTGTAGEGIEAIRRHPPDAVILDVRLPDMPGLDAFDEIRRIDSRLPVIMITAFSTTETAIEAMKRKVPATMTECAELIEHTLLKGPWVFGAQYTICDPYLFTIGTWLEGDGVNTSKLPRIIEHRRRMLARGAVQKAVSIEGTQLP